MSAYDTLALAEGAALRAAIAAEPADDTPRLAYADWLDENDTGHRLNWCGSIRAWFIRWQIRGDTCGQEVASIAGNIPYTLAWFVDKRHLWGSDNLSKAIRLACGNQRSGDRHFGSYSWGGDVPWEVWCESARPDGQNVRTVYRRGFPDEVQCPLAAWVGGRCLRCSVAHVNIGSGLVATSPDGESLKIGKCPSCYGAGTLPGAGPLLLGDRPVTRVTMTDRRAATAYGGFCWFVGNRSPTDGDMLPTTIWEAMSASAPHTGGVYHESARMWRFDDRAPADAALSAACLLWARREQEKSK